jgi:hypothetical protein
MQKKRVQQPFIYCFLNTFVEILFSHFPKVYSPDIFKQKHNSKTYFKKTIQFNLFFFYFLPDSTNAFNNNAI